MSNVSHGSNQFRDTELSELEALKTMRIQSLTSIVNHPKKDSLISKLGRMMKDNIKKKKLKPGVKKYTYKPMTEKDVSDSHLITKVEYGHFENFLRSTESNSRVFERNQQFEEQKKLSKSVDAIPVEMNRN